jgi:cation transporter-like permease
MLTLQAILLTSSLLMVVAMVGSMLLLASTRARIEPDAVPVESADQPL